MFWKWCVMRLQHTYGSSTCFWRFEDHQHKCYRIMQLRRWEMRKQMGLEICSKRLLWITHGLQPLNWDKFA